jgi:hypothetical protein
MRGDSGPVRRSIPSAMLGIIDRLSGRRHTEARRRKMNDFLRLCRPAPDSSVLDVGVLGDEPYEAANFFLKEYPYPRSLTALSIEDCSALRSRYPLVRFVAYDGERFPFADNSFDICHSNAVVEHVGDCKRQQWFVSEMVRVARQGFFTTPNRWFPVELHTKIPLLHYLPWGAFLSSCRLLGRENQIKGVRLLDRGQVRSFIQGAPVLHHQILGNRVLGMTVTFSVCWRK